MKWLLPTDIVVVTGGNNGLGREILREFARKGCQTVSLDIKPHVAPVKDAKDAEAAATDATAASATEATAETTAETSISGNDTTIIAPADTTKTEAAPEAEAALDAFPEVNATAPSEAATSEAATSEASTADAATADAAVSIETTEAPASGDAASIASPPASEPPAEEENLSPSLTISCDVRKEQDLAAALEQIRTTFDRYPTVIVLNAGIRHPMHSIADSTYDDLQSTIDVNLGGVMKSLRTFLPGMVGSQRGFVVTIASALGIVVPKGLSAYGATKAGLIGIHEGLVQELSDYKDIHSLLVCPGQLDTAMFSDITTPSDTFAPVVSTEKLAKKIVKRVSKAKTSTIYAPAYVRYLPFMNVMPVSISRMLRKMAGVDSVYDGIAKTRAVAAAEAQAANNEDSVSVISESSTESGSEPASIEQSIEAAESTEFAQSVETVEAEAVAAPVAAVGVTA